MAIFPGSAITPAGGAGYTIDQSLRFEDGSSAYLSRTPASAGNRKTWTWSGWVKLGKIGATGEFLTIFGSGNASTNDSTLAYGDARLYFYDRATGKYLVSDALYRDSSAWYHFVMALDTTQASASDRIAFYVNGEKITAFSQSNMPTLNQDLGVNNSIVHYIGARNRGSIETLFDGYMAEVHFIDGQALTPDYFGEVDETYGHWKPIEYTGTYGTNGFYLPFSGTFYNDASGNGNNWTANNLATTDVVLDSPTNNFAVMNPLLLNGGGVTASSYKEGNLQIDFSSSGGGHGSSTISVSSGKWYCEFALTAASSANAYVGIRLASAANDSPYSPGETTGSYGYRNDGQKFTSGTGSSYGASWTTNDVIGLALDLDSGTLTFYKNGTTQGQAFSGITGTFLCAVGDGSTPGTHTFVCNFGQDSSFAGNKTAQNNTDANGYGDFYYAPPSGFLALCTANLSDPAVVPGENFNTVLWTGDGNNDRSITGFGHNPDLVWLKMRSAEAAQSHHLVDRVRGGSLSLYSNLTNAETSFTAVKSFITDGFTTDANGGSNSSGRTYVAWGWKANNTSGSSNTDGSITSTVAANVDAGFSIVSYTGTGANATVGHGLDSAPEMVIVKSRTNGAQSWCTWHTGLSGGAYALFLEATNAESSQPTIWNSTVPTSTVFSVGTANGSNQSANNFIAYCFHSVPGFSKAFSYTGNGSSDGSFIFCDFRPAFVMLKRTDAISNWIIWDGDRDAYNLADSHLLANSSNAESTTTNPAVDLISNGVKLRGSDTSVNASGGTYIGIAFAEYPFKYSNAR